MVREEIEIMAPVGSFESLIAAIQGGADSVYFGVQHLNMRAVSSGNFTLDDLTKITDICNNHKIKSYLTLNTILYDHDLGVMHKIVEAAKNSDVTAVIVSDPAAIFKARTKGVEIHISTQLNISNI